MGLTKEQMGFRKGNPCDLLKPHLRGTDVAVDVGASIGEVTKFLAQHVGHVHACEPHPEQVKTLHELAATFKHVTVHQVACGATSGVEWLTFGTTANTSSLVRANVTHPTKSCEVRVTRLDDLVDTADVLKIDAQGRDVDVLLGGPRVLARCRVVAIECWPHGLTQAGQSARALCDLLWAAGFSITVIGGHEVTPAGLDAWVAKCQPNTHTNFLAVR